METRTPTGEEYQEMIKDDFGPYGRLVERMAEKQDRERSVRRVMFWFGCLFIAFALVAAIHVAAAAPGKIARTSNLYIQIEGMRQ